MLRRLLLSLALCLPAVSQAGSIATLDIGGATVRMEVPEGYVRVSERSPELLAFQQGMLPATNRLVESLMTGEDLARVLSGKDNKDIGYQLQAMRQLERIDITATEWPAMRNATMEQIGGLDFSKLMDSVEGQANRTLDSASGGQAEIRLGDPSRPMLYDTDDADAVHFSMVMPVELEVGGEKSQGRIAAACVMTVLSKRVVLLYAFIDATDGDDKARAAAQSAVDALAVRARTLQSEPAQEAEAPPVIGSH